jgi:hypothetical protein
MLSSMQESQIIYWRTEPFTLESRQSLHYVRPVWMHSPEFIAIHGEGWNVIHCGIAGSHEDSGDIIMAATLSREIPTDL